MEIEDTPLEGLKFLKPKIYEDSRGFFYELFNTNRFGANGLPTEFRQDNHARSVKGTLRGLHFQRGAGQIKLIRCLRGRIWDVAVDIRPGSPTRGKFHAVELTDDNHGFLFIPGGFAHGYAVLSDEAEVFYKCDRVYDPELEDGIAWDDPELAVPWPVEHPILSERDTKNRSFREYLESMQK
jgi:dTDP-4-dehydrorhamnose 3,5-epimerase